MSIKKTHGFTMVEMLVSMAVLITVIFLLAEIFQGQGLFFQRENARTQVVLDHLRALNDMTAQARPARRVVAASTFDSVDYASGPNQLILELSSIDSQGQPLAGNFDYAVYYLHPQNQKKLMKKVIAAPASSRPSVLKALAEDVNQLNFFYDNPDFNQVKQVMISLSSLKTAGGSNFSASSTVRAVLRNR